jgi:hypothetical protein
LGQWGQILLAHDLSLHLLLAEVVALLLLLLLLLGAVVPLLLAVEAEKASVQEARVILARAAEGIKKPPAPRSSAQLSVRRQMAQSTKSVASASSPPCYAAESASIGYC